MEKLDYIKKIKKLEIITNRRVNEVFAGNYKSSFRGQGLELSDLRRYEDGDDVRYIDWISTAKQGVPYVKRFQETREMTTFLIIDLSASMNFSSTLKTKKEIVLELSAILLFSALKNSDKFACILHRQDFFSYIPPTKGKKHLLRILREIINGFENNQYKKNDTKKALDFLNNLKKRHTICFFVSDEISTEKEFNTALRIANKKHDFVFVNIFDKFERAIDYNGVLKIEDIETACVQMINLSDQKLKDNYKRIRQEKYNQMKEILQKNKIESLEISTEDDVYANLLRFFQKRF